MGGDRNSSRCLDDIVAAVELEAKYERAPDNSFLSVNSFYAVESNSHAEDAKGSDEHHPDREEILGITNEMIDAVVLCMKLSL